ncbi:hypothetical protein J5Y09_00800 [Roseomonas sp. PWR1]|uniref:Uncharacterized protein n=1 Tax=Roseomonas nitratireducens TaxID=2820810 RepID=A0ABS4AM46_9PROT|nr:hypothetical protein [Neoroseomonas nitratireducens]MBP0462435.1 hypothetical protein [Neoroseomonas nitratireducens]
MDPVPAALRGIVAAMWERELADGLATLARTPCEMARTVAVELAAEPGRRDLGFLTRLAMGEVPAEERAAFLAACARHREGGPLAGIAHLPTTAALRKVLFPMLAERFGEKPVAAGRMEFLMIAARAPVPMRLWMDTASRGQGLRWAVQVVRLPDQRTRHSTSFEALLGIAPGMSGWDRIRADRLEEHAALLVERVAGTVAALSAVDWDAAGR